MLEKLIRLNNVGVFKQGLPKAVDLEKVTLVYGENARGKSTLAAVLQSLSSGNVLPVTARASFGGGPPAIELRYAKSGVSENAEFKNNAWNVQVPALMVFDKGFVERNVYAASEVGPDNHQALLEFALGLSAVKKKQEVEEAGTQQTLATKRRTAFEDQLKGHMGKTSLAEFLKLTEEPEADNEIERLQRRILDAKDAAIIGARPTMKELPVLHFDFAPLVAVLSQSLDGVHAEAETRVKEHVAHVGGAGTEHWIATGLALYKNETCPFCAQSTKSAGLLDDYKAYFNNAYTEHAAAVASLPGLAKNSISKTGFDTLTSIHAGNLERVSTWSPQLKFLLDPPDDAKVQCLLARAETLLQELVFRKQAAPFHPLEAALELQEAEACLQEARAVVVRYNAQVQVVNKTMSDYKAGLVAEKVGQLEVELQSLNLRKARYSTAVVDLVKSRLQADQEREAWEKAKSVAREELDKLMASVLGTFQVSINHWLEKFGAPFRVEKLKPTYQGGGTPRTEYGISVRGNSVQAGKKAAGPCFQTALSEGDKRTLALAFFLAKLFGEADKHQKVVVLDDLFTSLDKHRRAQTVDAISAMATVVEQVIVLAHDAFFLRDISRRIAKKGLCKQVLLHATRAADGYSVIEGFDVEDVCASDYYKRYRGLQDYLAGAASEPALSVAQGMRALLEGHLHRRFPGHVKEGVTVGVVLDQIKNAPPASPLSVLHPCLQGLHELNEFAGAFHHDTDGIGPRAEVTDTELVSYGSRTMQLLHTGQL